MTTTTVHAEATVSHLEGRAWIRGADGSLRELHVGDHVREGETLVTAVASSVELSNADGAVVAIGEGREVLADATLLSQDSPTPQEAALTRPDTELDQVIQALNSGNDPLAELDAAAAGLAGGDGQDGHSFVQLLRISEGTDPLSLTSSSTSTASSATIQSLASTTTNLVPTAADTTISTQEDTPVTGSVSATDANGNPLSFSAGDAPQHGTVVVNSDGTFTYTPSANYNGADSFTVTVSDGQGGSTTSTVNVGIAAVNDAPTTTNVTVSTSEDTPIQGTVVASDVDGDSLSYSAGNAPQHGTVVVNSDGTFTYTPSANYNGSDSFTVTVSDGQGGSTTSTVNVGIAAVNDAPTTSNVSVSTSEDTPISGTVVASDVDGDSLSFAKGSDPAHGSVVVNSDGTFTYTPSANYNGADSFTVTVSDGQGGSTTSIVSVGVTAVNDAPTTSVVTLASSPEDTAHTITAADLLGKATDIDGDALSVSNVVVDHGSVTANSDGTWTYTPDTNFNGQVSFSYTITDNGTTNGVTDPKSVVGSATLEVTPINDAAVIIPGSASLVETDAPLTTSGTLAITDVDSPATFQAQTNVAGSNGYGHFTVNTDGSWTYTANSAHNEFEAGKTYTDSITVQSADGTPSTITVEIAGSNDAAVITPAVVALTETDVPLSTSGTLAITDVDSPASFVAQTSVAGANGYGHFTVSTDGSWTYTADSAHNEFAAGKTYTDSITVQSADGTPSTITVEIAGSNDAAVITPAVVALTETDSAADISTSGTLAITDVDSPATFQAQTNVAGSNGYGHFTVNTDGSWTYTADSAHNEFEAGKTYTDSITVQSADGTPSTITVEIAGSNDAAVITPAVVALTETDVPLSTSGTLAITDVDSPASFVAQTSVAGANGYGHFTVSTDGSWTYTADSAHNEFAAGKTYTDSITVQSADGTPSTITVEIAGSNDAAVITPAVVALTETDVPLSTSGTLAITDVDSPATFQSQTNVAGSNGYGHFTVNTDGSWTYTADSAHNEFAAGKTYTDSITVQSADGTPSTITVEIAGTNDAAVITGTDSATTKEDTAPNPISGTLSVTDADAGEASFQVQSSTAGAHGTFSIDAAGHWTYTLNNADPAVQALGEGKSLPNETFTVKSLDGTEHTVTVAITGTNDVAVIGNRNVGDVTEAGGVANATAGVASASGTLTITDVDTNEASFQTPSSLAGTYGTFSFNSATGEWTYALDNTRTATQQLAAGQVVHDTLTVTSLDGTASKTIDVKVTGSNDAPTLTTQSFTTSEDTALSGKLTASDPEGDPLSYALASGTAHGTLTVNADGSFSYTPTANYNGTDSFTVKVSDSHGGTTTSTVSLGVTPVNDAPTTSEVTLAGTKVKATTITAAELLGKAADIDGDTLTVSNLQIASGGGSLANNGNGTWTYTPSGTGTVSFSYTITDNGSTNGVSDPKSVAGSAKLTVDSSYHNATISGDNAGAVTEDGGVANATHGTSFDSGTLTIKDSDSGQASFQPANTLSGTYGSFTFNAATGAWTYTLDNSKPTTQALTPSDTQYDTLTVYSLDGSASQTIKVTITGANDTPTVASSTVSGTEDTPLVLSWAQFHVSDVDGGSSSGITITSLPKDGQLQYYNGSSWVAVSLDQTISQTEIDANHLRFVPDANESGNSSYSTAGLGDQHADYASFSFTATDGISSSSSASVTIDIAPVADGPVIQVNGSSIVAGAAIIATPAFGDGLTTRTYTSLGSVSTTTVDTAAEVSTLLTRLDAATTSLASTSISGAPQNYTPHSGSSPTGISEDGAYRMTGLIYMEAGKTYTFSSYMDDTAILKIGGQEVLNKAYNSWGNITATTFSPTVSGYYTLDWAVYNGNGVGAVKPYLSVDGGTALELTSSNFNLYSSVSTLDSTGAVHLGLVGDSSGGYYPAYNSSVEDTAFKLSPISVTLADTDGSEHLGSISISGLPEGSVITDGTHSFTATSGATSVVITSWSLSSLSFTPPHDFNGTVTLSLTATSTETATGQTGSTTATLPILVTGVNDAPVAVADNASVTEDSGSYTVNGSVTSNDTDVDGDKLHVAAVNGQVSLLAQDVAATYGSFHINADGSYTYQLANDNAQVNALNKGEVLHDTISYTVADPSGETSTATLTVTINGADETSANVIDSSLATVAGTAGADLIHASAANSIVDAGSGNDIVHGSDSSQATDQATLNTSNFMGANSNDTANHLLGNVIHGGDGNDALFGGAHSDLLDGGAGNDYLSGGAGNDALRGGDGNDRIEGGAGSDVLMGGTGSDVFVWSLGDAGTAGTSSTGNSALGIGGSVGHASTTDLVTDFTKGSGGDALDLRDLLQGESHLGQDPGNLTNYLHFEVSNGNTVVHVSSSGGFTGGTYNASHEDQTIVLTGVNLLIDGTTTLLNDANIINNLLTNKNLITD